MIEIKNVNYEYVPGKPVLNNISATFRDSEPISVVLGESGSGKTTLLRLLGRFLLPQSGEILVKGKEISTIEEKQFRKMVGIVFQQLYLFPHLTVMGNMTLALQKVFRVSPKEAQQRSLRVLERLGLQSLKSSYPCQLSGGQAQRAAIARALVLEPDYLLLDEPTSALDINTTNDFCKWLKTLQENTRFIIVTHDLPFAHEVAHEGILLQNGEVYAKGDIEEITDVFTNTVQEAKAG
ncbi:ATP-binding cassette domain-containing protein [Chitinispirillales bacterium ANBcel5]|uniref:ATP-binding cassette domain-containing protein n=1 Tax=Cellulosispirillum alkaliphilum TaxID=3039283 RepID=UPI002A5472E6|nr:ATP-binding cassette domain-containing protein [Chitinispirillales bacterium ANBcel5]